MPTADEDPLLVHGWDRAASAGTESGVSNGDVQDQPTNLADLILAKIAEKEAGSRPEAREVRSVDEYYEVPPKVADVFSKQVMLSRAYSPGPCRCAIERG